MSVRKILIFCKKISGDNENISGCGGFRFAAPYIFVPGIILFISSFHLIKRPSLPEMPIILAIPNKL